MSESSDTSSHNELTQLRARVAELEHQLSAAQAREQVLHESETRLRFIVEGSSDGAWDWDMVKNETFLSPRWFEMFGYEPNELPNNIDTWLGSLHPDDKPEVMQLFQDYLAGRVPTYEIENRMWHKSGVWLWTLGRGKVVVRDANGQPLRMTGTVSDISARKQAEESLRQNQRLLQAVIDNSPAVIYVRDINFRYLMVNRNHAAIFNKQVEEIVGKTDSDLFPADVVELFRETDRDVLDNQQTVTAEETLLQADGMHTYISVKFPLYDDTGKLYAFGGISTDVTDNRRAILERTALQEQIIDAQRAALRELSSPLIPIADGIVIMPLIGAINDQRAQQVMENLLEGVEKHRATSVILDITGVQVVDTQVASALVRAAQAVKLLGAQVIVTGIRPEIAQTIIGMGADLSGLLTYATLQHGIAYALQQQSMGRKPTTR